MEQLIGRFSGTGDDGQTYTILVYQEMLDPSFLEDPFTPPGPIRIITSCGIPLHRICKGVYERLDNGLTLRTHDLSAP